MQAGGKVLYFAIAPILSVIKEHYEKKSTNMSNNYNNNSNTDVIIMIINVSNM